MPRPWLFRISQKKPNLIIVLLYIVVKKMAKSAPLKNTVWDCSWRSCIVRSTQVLVSYLLSDNQLICRLRCLLKSTIIVCRLLANEKRRVLDLRTRTTTGTGFNLKFFSRILVIKYSTRKASLYYFSPEKLVRLFYWRRFNPFPVAKWLNLYNLIACSRHYEILAKTLRRMTTAIMFSRQKIS